MSQMEFDDSNGNSSKYELEANYDSVAYTRELERGYLSGFYYLIFWKGYFKEKNIWELALAI